MADCTILTRRIHALEDEEQRVGPGGVQLLLHHVEFGVEFGETRPSFFLLQPAAGIRIDVVQPDAQTRCDFVRIHELSPSACLCAMPDSVAPSERQGLPAPVIPTRYPKCSYDIRYCGDGDGDVAAAARRAPVKRMIGAFPRPGMR